MIPLLVLLVVVTHVSLNAARLGLINKAVSDADKNDILNADDDDAFSLYLNIYNDDVVVPIVKAAKGPEAMKKIRAQQKKNFVKNLNKIKAHNKKYKSGKSKFEMTVNSFTTLSEEERQKFLGLNVSTEVSGKYMIEDRLKTQAVGATDPPAAVDWKDWMTGVKNQGGCGSCWSFPTVALVEFAYTASTGNKLQLSEQEIVDCIYERRSPGYDSCKGGWYFKAWDWVIEKDHIASMASYPYKGVDGKCNYQQYRSAIKDVLRIKGYKKVPIGNEAEVIKAMQIMPLAVAFMVLDDLYSVGKHGIYDGCDPRPSGINHAVTLTAYTPEYWEIRNSWGPDWGYYGYIKFERPGRGSICNLLDWAYYIAFEDLDSSDEDEYIPSLRVTQSSTYGNMKADLAVDGSLETGSHTECTSANPWFRYYLPSGTAVNKVRLVNGKLSYNRGRLDGATVKAVRDQSNSMLASHVCGIITVTDSDTILSQTYELDCEDYEADYIEVSLDKTECLELRDIKVYGVEVKEAGEVEYIPSQKVAQSSTLTWDGVELTADLAVDGSFKTGSHTECMLATPWFRYYLPSTTAVNTVFVVNGKLNNNRIRLDGATVKAVRDQSNSMLASHVCGIIQVRDSDTILSQTYELDCEDYEADYIEVSLDKRECLELRDIKVYGVEVNEYN